MGQCAGQSNKSTRKREIINTHKNEEKNQKHESVIEVKEKQEEHDA